MFEQVKQEIDNKIKTNGNNEITATRLNGVLQDMMDATAEELSGYVQKTDPPSPAAGDIVVFNEFGGLGTSEKTVNDFATASQGAKADTALQPTGVKTINNQSIVGSGNITIEGGGTDDYADLDNKPQINSVALSGNKSASDLGLATAAQGAKADTAVQPSALNDYVQKSQTTGLLKNDGTVDTQTADRAESALQPLSGAQENNFASFDSDGGIKDSGCNEGTFIKGVQQNGVDLQKNANGKVNVTVQDGEDGLSAFEIAQQQGYTGTVDQWLASLKANIGEYLFVPTDAAAVTAMATIGQTYPSAIDPNGKNVAPTQDTLSVILLMNDDDTTPSKTMMIATQEVTPSTTPASYEFVYAGDLQSAMPSNVVTEDDIDNSFAGGSDKVASAEEVKTVFVDNANTSNNFNFNFNGALATELNVKVDTSNNTIIATSHKTRYLAIPCKVGDVIEIERNDTVATTACFLKTLIPYRVNQPLVFSEESGFTTVKNLSTVGYHYIFTVPQDVTFILVQVRTDSATENNQTPKLLKLNGVDLFKSFSERVDEKVQYSTDLSNQVTEKGFYSVSGQGAVVPSDGWMHYLLRISPGDRVVTNYNHNTSHTYACNCLFAEDMVTPVRIFNCTNDYTVTLQDWNDGARYYGVSFRLAEPSVNNTPYLYLTRNFGMSAMYTADDLSAEAKVVKDKVVVKLENLSNFDVFVYDKKGRKIHHNFIREHKEWDSLEYIDENGETQTATNVQSANIWYCNEISYDTKHLCQGNTNFINNPNAPVGNGLFVGNGHGCEVMQYVKFLIDGKDFDISVSSDELVGNEFKMIMMTHIYPSAGGTQYVATNIPKLDTSGNPVVLFKHFMEVTITPDSDVIVDNKLEVCQDNVSWLSCDSAMMECYYGDFNTVVLSGRGKTYMSSLTDEGTPTAIAGTDGVVSETAVYASKVEMYGKGFYVSNEIIPMFNDAHCVVYPYYYDNRLKCYLYPVRCSRAVGSDTPQVFNTGDIIATHNIRHVRLSDDIEI